MSEEKNNIDHLFSDAAQNQKAPQYNSAYWGEMNAILNARAAKRRGMFLWTSIGVFFCLFLITTLFITNTNNTDTRVQYAQTKLNLQSDVVPYIKGDLDAQSQSRSNLESSENNNFQASSDRNHVQENASNTASQNGNSFTRAQNAEYRNNLSQRIGNKNTTSKSGDPKSTVNQNTKYQNTLNQRDNINSTSNETLDGNNSSIASGNSDKERSVQKDKMLTNKEASNAIKESGVTEESIDKELLVNKSSINKDGSNDKVSNDIDMENADDDKLSLPAIEASQLAQNTPGNILDPRIKRTSKTQFSLYAKLSGGLMENYKTARPYQSGVVDLSFNFEARFNSLLLRTGIGTQYTTHADLVVSERAKIYGFGARNQQNDLSYQDLLDIYIPIEFGYQLRSTSFGIGVQANYLLTTSMDFNTYQDQVLTNTEKYYGNTNGLRPLSTQGYIWVEQRLFPRFSMGLKIGTNISGRIKDSKYFNQSATINPIYGQLTFRLNIL